MKNVTLSQVHHFKLIVKTMLAQYDFRLIFPKVKDEDILSYFFHFCRISFGWTRKWRFAYFFPAQLRCFSSNEDENRFAKDNTRK